MFLYVFSIIMIVASNTMYHICQKSTPERVNPFVALLVTYATAIIMTAVTLIFYKPEKGLIESIKQLNWTSIVLGISIVGLELGYLLAYRAGWNISVGSLVANILLALVLIPIGIILYHEKFELSKVIGSVFCIVGLILINRK
ncbi:MAG TPA: EamA family transporter [Clostridiales bacterium]|nr:EamA family transporter [Clostridiales bacterium]HOL91175.1 EamA family transporter [Clostridiales bacterium]HPP34925.1 EamA family transporter [Clostridiales bacterium]